MDRQTGIHKSRLVAPPPHPPPPQPNRPRSKWKRMYALNMCQHFKIFKTPSVRTNRTGRGCISNSLNSLWNFYTHAPGMLLMYIHAPACYRCVSMHRHVIDAYPCTGMLSMRIHAPACYRCVSMHRHAIDVYPCTGMLSMHIHAPACYRRISMHRHVIDVYPCTGMLSTYIHAPAYYSHLERLTRDL